ncbi:MAG: hypothetical protein HQK57_16455, partial [Deltaproteobacteria bacterium]|nr:hypothetical protein [Deltaproteobacteria bacterium]
MKKLLVACLAVAVCLMLAAPAMAEFKVGFLAYTDLGWSTKDKMLTVNQKENVTSNFLNMPGHSRVYGTFKKENVTGYFEIGLGNDELRPRDVNLRKLYGVYHFGNHQIQAGQTEPIAARFNPPQLMGLGVNNHIIMIGWGNPNYERLPVANYSYSSGPFTFMGGFFAPPGGKVGGSFTAPATGTDMYWNVPGVEMKFAYRSEMFYIAPAVAWGQVKWEGTPDAVDNSANCFLVNMPVQINFGLVTFKMNPYIGRNIEGFTHYVSTAGGFDSGYGRPLLVSGKMYDTNEWGGWANLFTKVGIVGVNLMYGRQQYNNDDWKTKAGYSQDSYNRNAYVL